MQNRDLLVPPGYVDQLVATQMVQFKRLLALSVADAIEENREVSERELTAHALIAISPLARGFEGYTPDIYETWVHTIVGAYRAACLAAFSPQTWASTMG